MSGTRGQAPYPLLVLGVVVVLVLESKKGHRHDGGRLLKPGEGETEPKKIET